MQTFADLGLRKELQSGLDRIQFNQPTPIQAQVIPMALEGADVIACAETGSGKTAAYGIPLVERLLASPKGKALVLAPTRELVHQIADFLKRLVVDCRQLEVVCLVGGSDMRRQFQALRRSPRIVVATPGRLADHLRRRSLSLMETEMLILDEGDRMLDMGFAPQLDEILKFLPKERQTLLFTATLPQRVRKLAETYLDEPRQMNVGRTSLPVASIKQSVVQVGNRDKDERIVDELNARTGSVIVFARTQRRTDLLARHLSDFGFSVELIHGGRTQGQRNRAIQNFRNGRTRILCATDIAARGIDVPQVEHVINFDLPMMDEDYVHRIGRTARNGASGEAVSFVTPEENRTWQSLVRKYKITGADLKVVERRGDKKSFGGKKEFGPRKEFGPKKEFGPRKPFGAKKEFSSKKKFGSRDDFGSDKEFGSKSFDANGSRGKPKKAFGGGSPGGPSKSKPWFKSKPKKSSFNSKRQGARP